MVLRVLGVCFIQPGLFLFSFISGLEFLKLWPNKPTFFTEANFLSEDSHLVVKPMLIIKHRKVCALS